MDQPPAPDWQFVGKTLADRQTFGGLLLPPAYACRPCLRDTPQSSLSKFQILVCRPLAISENRSDRRYMPALCVPRAVAQAHKNARTHQHLRGTAFRSPLVEQRNCAAAV